MIFTGDVAQPYVSASLYAVPEVFKTKTWLGNIEGSLIERSCLRKDIRGVYNDIDSIRELIKHIPFKFFNIANNHLLDMAEIQTTLDNAQKLGVPVVGAGYNLQDAQKPLVVADSDAKNYRILAFGWENIQCVPAQAKKPGVNPYTRKNVLHCVSEALKEKQPVICFMHWDYELEKYPQPYDRQMAMDLIDMGVAAVIGCHAHRVQPIEFYKGKPIVYGLGNFLFCQRHYFGGKLQFPKFCEEEYAFEISNDVYKLHYFHYDQDKNKLEFVKTVEVSEDKKFEGKAVFANYSAREYESFFEKNRIQKKMLPVFKTHESAMSYWAKSEWIKLRGWMLDTAMKLNIKSAKRAER